MLEFVLAASIFGLVAGLKPGPLGIVVIQQTLSRGLGAGARASMAPLITDVPIILAAYFLLINFKDITPFIAVISLLGGLNLLIICAKIFQVNHNDFDRPMDGNSSLWMAVRVNFLNPNPYIFWFTIGGSYLVLGTPLQSGVFILFSVAFLILAKMFVAFLAVYFREFLSGNAYLYVMKSLALMLGAFGVHLIYKSYTLSGFENYVFN